MAKRAAKARFPLLEHVDKQMAKLHENVAGALGSFDEEAIHDTRVATRRMKAAMDLMGPVLTKQHRKPLAKGLRKLRRRLGPLRDVDVMILHLSRLAEQARHHDAADWLRQRLEASRQRLRAESQAGASAEKSLRRVATWPMVRAEMGEALEAIDCLLAESLHLQIDAFAEQANRLASTSQPRQNPHDVRIAGKALRYTLEMAEAQGRSPGSRLVKSFKRMQEQLGAWHDWVVLSDACLRETVDAQLTHLDPSLSECVIELGKFALKRSGQELLGFCKLWNEKGSDLADSIRTSFPLTQPALSQTQMDLDPAATASPEVPEDAASEATPNV